MTITHNFIGCDTSKHRLDVFDPAKRRWQAIANEADALRGFAAGLDTASSFVVMEATGHHDRLLRHALAQAGIAFARINPLQARRFAQAKGRLAKTDRIDAKGLSEIGAFLRPRADPAPEAERERLCGLARRRDQLVAMRAREMCHRDSAQDEDVQADIQAHLVELGTRIKALEQAIAALMAKGELAARGDLLKSAPGIGPVTAAALLAHMPELGRLSPKAAASLAGLAPHPNDSGQSHGARRLKGGRPHLRRALYMAALSAIKACQRFQSFFQTLSRRAGSKKLAILAVARKLLTALNAMIRDNKTFT